MMIALYRSAADAGFYLSS